MDRRNWLRCLTALSLAGFSTAGWAQKTAKGAVKVEDLQKNWKTLLAEGADVAASAEPLKLSDAEWKKRLSPAAYDVLRHEGTERAGTSPLDREKRPGVFVCAGCSLPLFTSAMKFESRPACATATTAWRCDSYPRGRHRNPPERRHERERP